MLQEASGKTHDGPGIDEWYDGKGFSLFGCELKSLRLPIVETPEIPWETDLSKWQRVSWSKAGEDIGDPPMFTVIDSDASFTIGFHHWNQPFTTIVEETRGGVTNRLPRKELLNYHLPMYRAGGPAGSPAAPGRGQ